jgi:hypothetical protein
MDYTKIFYWLTVADSAKTVFLWMLIIFGIIVIISTIFNFVAASENDEKSRTLARQWMWRTYPFFLTFLMLHVLIPSKKDSLLIIAGGQTLNFLTTDKSSKQIPAELSGFVLTELKNMAKEASVDLNIASQKEKVLEKAKSMSSEELLQTIKNDSTFAKIILEK